MSQLFDALDHAFGFVPEDRAVLFLGDWPAPGADDAAWVFQRQLLLDWFRELLPLLGARGIGATLAWYDATGRNNGELPATARPQNPTALAPDPEESLALPLDTLFGAHKAIIAMNRYSATAPLKKAAPGFGFRAASMPGFTPEMMPAMLLPPGVVPARVERLKRLLDQATGALLAFCTPVGCHELYLDLRGRTAHSSAGLFHQPGIAGNLPSGEAYIVPYEGEVPALGASLSNGVLPVELDGEIVLYRIDANRATAILSQGPVSEREGALLKAEPAMASLAELGLGVLAELGVEPVGEVLLDEKLGLHIAFGRSDHFGGAVGPKDFSSPAAAAHIDRIYIRQCQPWVKVPFVDLELEDGSRTRIIEDGRYVTGLFD